MFASLKTLMVAALVLSVVPDLSAAQPERSVIDGSRSVVENAAPEPTCGTAIASDAVAPACSDPCQSACCQPKCRGHLKHSRLSCGKSCAGQADTCNSQVCSDNTCDDSACGKQCGKHHGCWLHGGNGSCGAGKHGCGKHDCGHHGQNCDGYHDSRFATRCNMIPHVAYIHPMSSYYYFRPYQAFHVREQQTEVTSYGADPRQPYANLLFRTLYTELEAAWAEEEGQHGSPFEDEAPGVDGPAAEEEPGKPLAPDFNTSTSPANPMRPRYQATPAVRMDKPANDTAALPSNSPGVFRSRQ